MLLTSSFAGADTISWIGGAGNWHKVTKWYPAQIPLLGDDVVTHGGLITVDSDVTINSLTLGPSDGPDTLTLNSGIFTIDSVCINDPSTGLCWDNYDSGTLMDWAAAGTYCSGEGTRLPTIEELVLFASEGTVSFAGTYAGSYFYVYLIDTDLRQPRLAARGYGYTVDAHYWSSTESIFSPLTARGSWTSPMAMSTAALRALPPITLTATSGAWGPNSSPNSRLFGNLII